ncbi:nuclear mRNA export, poly(A)+RNA binding protein [Thoreauomyces humboldtii]|nr:nuclear mRNA export, poly(A)+RNA binding protein [Thoreauomyces humboldtii]
MADLEVPLAVQVVVATTAEEGIEEATIAGEGEGITVQDTRDLRTRWVVVMETTRGGASRAIDGAGLGGLAKFLHDRILESKGLDIGRIEGSWQNDGIVFQLPTPAMATAVQTLSGIRFRQEKVTKTIASPGPGFGQSSSVQRQRPPLPGNPAAAPPVGDERTNFIFVFRTLILSRYNAPGKFLDLSDIGSDPLLSALFPRPQHPFDHHTSKVGPDNRLNSLASVEELKGSRFPRLRELLLSGNPVAKKAVTRPGGEITYRQEIKRLFPTIEVLDMEPVVADISFAVDPGSEQMPLSAKVGFIDAAANTIAPDFIKNFLHAFDTNRQGLLDIYHEQACFSLSLDTTPPQGSRDPLQLSLWRGMDHNLQKHKSPEPRVSSFASGAENIIRAFGKLPKTRHAAYPALSHEGSHYLVEAYQMGEGPTQSMYILIHGQVVEDPRGHTNVVRSFDRTFVIVAPGARSAQAGLPYSVANDQLVIRALSPPQVWQNLEGGDGPRAATATPQLPDPATLKNLQMHHQLDDARQQQLIEFSMATGLNYTYSLQCLSETGWVQQAAMQAFENAKDQLPPAAFHLG